MARLLRSLVGALVAGAAATLGLSAATVAPASACSCVGGTPAELARSADVVFTGVVSLRQVAAPPHGVAYSFAVGRVYGGDVPRSVVVVTGSESSACGLPDLAVGAEYVVFADRAEEGRLQAGACGGTRPVSTTYVDRLARVAGESRAPAAGPPAERSAAALPGVPADDAGGGAAGAVPIAVVGVAAGAVIVAALAVGARRTSRRAGPPPR